MENQMNLTVDKVAELFIRSYGLKIYPQKWDSLYVYEPTDKLIEKTKEFREPRLLVEIAAFALYGKHNSQYNNHTEWHLKPENAQKGIDLLLEAQMPSECIVEEILKAVQGKSAFNTIDRYSDGVAQIKPFIKNNADVYGILFKKLVGLITPEMIEQAVKEIKFSDEEYDQKNPVTGGNPYFELEKWKKEIDDNKPIHGNKLHGFVDKEYIDHKLKYLQEEQLPPLLTLLNDLELELGTQKFKIYENAKKNVLQLNKEAESNHEYIAVKLTELEKSLTIKNKKFRLFH